MTGMIKTDVSPLDIKCTCCCGEEDLKDIAFGHNKVWTAICLCRNCRNELRQVLGVQEPEKIVRCGECTYWHRISVTHTGHCHNHMIERMTSDSDFCSKGSQIPTTEVHINPVQDEFISTCIFCLNKFKSKHPGAEICPECQREQSKAARENPDLQDEM